MDELSLTGRRWQLAPVDAARVTELALQLRLPEVVARCLLQRAGLRAGDWLRPSWEHLHDPFAMLGMDRAVARIREAAARGEAVRIVTDYDVDGTTSSLILQRTMSLAGVRNVDYHIPHRFDEGYGFSVRAAEAAAADGIKLIVTADIGVRDHKAVEAATSAGVDVIVCDHHLPAGESVPEQALAVLCPPQQGCDYPNKALAACGVSLKLAQALLDQHPKRELILSSMLKVAAIGTVADVVDLSTLENRAIVSLGLDAMRAGPNAPGLHALLEVAGLDKGQIDASDLGFRLGPRINAAGRLAEANAVISLFDERDLSAARARAKALDRLNAERQGMQEKLIQACLKQLPSRVPDFVVLWGQEEEGWHRGIVGIAAAKIRDRVHRPTAICAVSGAEARGSVRSTGEIHAVDALSSAADLLLKFGGHPVAAGFTVPTRNLEALAERLADFASQNAGSWVPTLELDARCALGELNRGSVEALTRLGPHGKGNPPPMLALEPGVPQRISAMGERHLRFDLGPLQAIWWGGAQHREALQGPVSVVATPGFHTWQGRTTMRLTVEDIRVD